MFFVKNKCCLSPGLYCFKPPAGGLHKTRPIQHTFVYSNSKKSNKWLKNRPLKQHRSESNSNGNIMQTQSHQLCVFLSRCFRIVDLTPSPYYLPIAHLHRFDDYAFRTSFPASRSQTHSSGISFVVRSP